MDKASLIRTALLVIALINQVLVVVGYSPLPISDAELELVISTVFTIVVSLLAWWKNNYLSKRGKAQAEALKAQGLK